MCCRDGLGVIKSVPVKIFTLVFCAVFLAACGQKGPLFLPGSPSTISSPVPGQQQAPVEEAEEKSKEQTDNSD